MNGVSEILKGWRTVAYGVLLGILSIFSNADMQAYVGEHLPWIGGGIATIIIVLRALTNSPIFSNLRIDRITPLNNG